LINFCISQGPTFPSWCRLQPSIIWTLVSTSRLRFSSHKSCSVHWISKQSAIVLVFSVGWYWRLKWLWIAVGNFGPSIFMRKFTVDHIARGVTSQFPIFVSQRSSVFLWVVRLMDFLIQLTAVLRTGSLVSCLHSWQLWPHFWCYGTQSCLSIAFAVVSDLLERLVRIMGDGLLAWLEGACGCWPSSVESSASCPWSASISADLRWAKKFWVGTSSLYRNCGPFTSMGDVAGFLAVFLASSGGFRFPFLCSPNSSLDGDMVVVILAASHLAAH
jgi:hypothetical protein